MSEAAVTAPEKEKVGWQQIAAIVVGGVLVITGIIRRDFAVMALGAGAFGMPGVSSMVRK